MDGQRRFIRVWFAQSHSIRAVALKKHDHLTLIKGSDGQRPPVKRELHVNKG
jgi:hypothetical protein